MTRDIELELFGWKSSKYRKPLVLKGARQTGKTWLMKEFGKKAYKKTVYINFEETPNLQNLFTPNLDTKRIIDVLQIQTNQSITPCDTLILFDEIQSVPGGITSLKYFYENAPQYHIIAAGSLLGLLFHSQTSFPVGKVDFLELHPLSFNEFLLATDNANLLELIKLKAWEKIDVFHDQLISLVKEYLFIGGMPEVVKVYHESRDWNLARSTQINILNSYVSDFSKHAPKEIVPRIQMVWNSIPAQLAKENKKFFFTILREGARAKDFELAIQWLLNCGLLLKSNRVSKPFMPLKAYEELSVFKLFLVDVGLLSAMSQLRAHTLIEGDSIFTEYKGALTEQYIMQQLVTKKERQIAYWTNEKSTAEVDFVVQSEGEIYPIEVKSGENTRSKSFTFFYNHYKPAHAIRYSGLRYRKESWLENYPLYAVI